MHFLDEGHLGVDHGDRGFLLEERGDLLHLIAHSLEMLRPEEGDLDYARLLLAAQWTGWSPEWKPPAEHRQDWRSIVLDLIEKLQL